MPILSAFRRTRNRVLSAVAWLTLAGLLALVVGAFPATAAKGQTDSCKPQPVEDSETGGDNSNYFQVNKQRFHFPFGESRSVRSQTKTVEAYFATPRNIKAWVHEFLDDEGSAVAGFETSAELLHAGDLFHPAVIAVCVSIDPARIDGLRPGRYEGTINVRADNYPLDASIPISATFRAPRGEGVKMAVAGVTLGLIVKMLTELGSGRRSKRRVTGLHVLRAYFVQWSFPLAIILGVLAGWFGFVEMYESNDTWGVGNGTDSLKLFATVFAFQMGSIGGADMTKRLVG